MEKTVVVTGGTGYIAGFIMAEFLNRGYAVRASVRDVARSEGLRKTLAGFVAGPDLSRFGVFPADLTSREGWAEAIAGTDGIIHVASPLGTGRESAAELRAVAETGTLNVLTAAEEAGVRRIVMTSSQAASTPPAKSGKIVLDESYWSDEGNPELDPYRLSKIAAERAAWAFAENRGLKLTTILPGAVLGPVMSGDNISSNAILRALLDGGMPKLIDIPFQTSDVRDLAVLHRLAFESEAAVGERFLAASRTIRMPEVARLYREKYPERKIPSKIFSGFAVRLLAKFVPRLRPLVPMLDREYSHTCEKAERLLGWTQHSPSETVLDAAESLLGMKD
ncbi:MAG: NAD-dependent epimerase/dehydratase family protein [Treponema sp.]|nr:NAD-dependent epimerase/dehydratase family protein [Treponema sp.]